MENRITISFYSYEVENLSHIHVTQPKFVVYLAGLFSVKLYHKFLSLYHPKVRQLHFRAHFWLFQPYFYIYQPHFWKTLESLKWSILMRYGLNIDHFMCHSASYGLSRLGNLLFHPSWLQFSWLHEQQILSTCHPAQHLTCADWLLSRNWNKCKGHS